MSDYMFVEELLDAGVLFRSGTSFSSCRQVAVDGDTLKIGVDGQEATPQDEEVCGSCCMPSLFISIATSYAGCSSHARMRILSVEVHVYAVCGP